MPVFELELTDGRKFQLETDRPPTDSELPDLLKQLEDSGSIQKMNPTEKPKPVFSGVWGDQPLENTVDRPLQETGVLGGPLQALAVLGAGALNLGQRTLQRMNQMIPRTEVVNGKVVIKPALTPEQQNQVARFEMGVVGGDMNQVKGPTFVPGQPIVKTRFPNEDIDPVNRAVGGLLRGFTTPEAVATLGLGGMVGQVASKLGQAIPLTVFGAPMLAEAPHATAQAAQSVGTVMGTPEQQRTRAMYDKLKEDIANEVLNKVMLGSMASHGVNLAKQAIAERPITPEVLPPEPPKIVPPTRQLPEPPPIDVETLGQPLLPQARRFYQSESKNPPVDASQLTQNELNARLETYKPLPPMEPKKAYTGEQVIIGENEPQNIAKELGLRYDGLQDWGKQIGKREVFTSLDKNNPFTIYVNEGTTRQEVAARLAEKQKADVKPVSPVIVPANVATKAPVEQAGGKVSFAAPAESGAIPSARQAALPEQGQKASSPQAPQMGQGEKMIEKGIDDSGEKSKAPINESDLSVHQNMEKRINEYGYQVHTDAQGYPWLYKGEQKVTIPQVPVEVAQLQDQLSEYGYKLMESGKTLNEELGKKPTVDEDGNKLSDSKNESNEGIEYRNTGALTKEQQDWISDFVTKGLTKMVNEGRVPTGQDKQRLELAAQDKVKHEAGLQTFAKDFNKELNRQAENLSLRGQDEIADRFNRAMDSQVLPHVRNAVERTETQKDGSVILEVDNYFHTTNQGRIALRRLANEGVRVSWEERNYAPGKSRLRLTKQEPNPNLNKEFVEQAKKPFIQHYNTGALTKQQQDWITSSARKLLSSPKDLKYNPDRKGEYDGGQLVNRLLNNVPPGEKEVLEQAGIREKFKAGQKVSSEEVDKWIRENEPKVEVRKFTTGSKDKRTMYESEERYLTQKQADIEHDLDTADSNWRNYFTLDEGIPNVRFPHYIKQEFGYRNSTAIDAKIAEFNHIQNQRFVNNRTAGGGFITSPNETHWQSIAPKPESEMKDYVEIAVVRPQKTLVKKGEISPYNNPNKSVADRDIMEQYKFPSSHNFPPNTLGFVRGYMEGDTFHVIEVQSDWAKHVKEKRERYDATPDAVDREDRAMQIQMGMVEKRPQIGDLLLAHYERLALKAAIEHARQAGAKRIAIQDAESAMLMEGLDRQSIPQRYEMATTKNGRTVVDFLNSGGQLYSMGGEKSRTKAFLVKGNSVLELSLKEVKKLEDNGVLEFAPEQAGNSYDTYWKLTPEYAADRSIPQEKGMRLHYDQILPKMLRELTGEQGEKVSFGEHKMAVEGISEMYNEDGTVHRMGSKPRQDLIFRNPDGTPKTDITALSFPLSKVSEAQSKAPFTTMGSDKVKTDKDEQGNVVYYHSGIPAPKEAIKAVKDMLTLSGKALNLYAEPIVEKLARVGGPVAKKATEEFQRMISRQKQVYGELSPVVDAAKKATGKMGGGNMWLRDLNNYTPNAARNNFFAVMEGAKSADASAASALSKLNIANRAIGNSAKQANPDFTPGGKPQRILTNFGYDIVRRGTGEAVKNWIEGTAEANGVPMEKVKSFVDKWKEELDKPSSDVASMDRISQDFVRKFPNTVTHVKSNGAWHEVVVADPFNYIESAAQRTSHAVAFREVYPLVRDPNTGKLGPSGYLQNTRKAIQKELNTAGFDANLFDNLVSAVQGHPLDTFTRGWNAPDSVLGAGYRMGQQVLGQPLKTLMLTANTISNAGEILSGGPAIFLGYHNVLPAMAKLATDNKLAGYLEFIGARNKAMYNFSFDPTSPVRSASRIVSSALRKATAQQLFNEIQETTAAMSAKFVADKIRNKDISSWEQGRIKAVARVMGFNEKQATDLVNGDSDLLRQFETKSAAMLTSGNQAMAEKSRLGTSRVFNELFWFQTYPQMKANQARKILGNFMEDVSNKNWSQAGHNAALAGRFIGGTGAQGVITLLLMGLATAGVYGLKQKKQQAEEETLKFAKDAMVSGMGGPLAILTRLAQNSKDSKSLTQGLVGLSPMVSSGQDLIDALAGTGRYEGRTVNERISIFLGSKSPGLDIAKTILSVSGLSQDDLKLRSDIKGFYSWRREQDGYKPASSGGGDEADIQLRTQMKRVKEAMQQGKDWMSELEKVKDLVYAQHSLRAGTMLELNSKPLSDEQLSSLEKRIGKEGVERLKTYDAMLRQVARELGDVNKEKKDLRDIKPTGDKYVDQTTESQRSEKVARLVKLETMQFLEANKKKVPSFEPSYGLTKKELMSKEQGEMYEQILAEEVDKRLASKMTNSVFASKPLVKRQAEIEERLELAKEIAATRFRAKMRQQALSQ